MIKKICINFVLLTVLWTAQACDDGLIPEKTYTPEHTGYTAKLTARISGADSWPEYYDVALAAFGDSEYSRTQTTVHPDADGNITLLLYNIGEDVQSVEFCVTNTLRRRVLTFASASLSEAVGDTIYLEAGDVDVSMYTAIQENIFNTNCATCHGLSTTAAAGLNLTEGNSYASLVDQPATSAEGTRVIPGNAEESVLHKVINPGNEPGLTFSHENMITSSTELRLIDEWINAGAQN